MVISGVGGTGVQMSPIGMSQANDPVSKNIQRQIESTQKQLQELNANREMSAEDKMKKRQELQGEINDLNMQLRQHQIEQRKEKQQEKSSSDNIFDSASQPSGNTVKAGKQTSGLSQTSMEAMISADTSMKQVAVQGSVATKMEGRAGVLDIEIKLDSGRPGAEGVVEKKQAELADVEQKAQDATAKQLGTLAEANKTMQDAAKADSDADTKKAGENNEGFKEETDGIKAADGEVSANSNDNNTDNTQSGIYYTPVDVRL